MRAPRRLAQLKLNPPKHLPRHALRCAARVPPLAERPALTLCFTAAGRLLFRPVVQRLTATFAACALRIDRRPALWAASRFELLDKRTMRTSSHRTSLI